MDNPFKKKLGKKRGLSTFFAVEPSPSLASPPAVLFFVTLALGSGFASAAGWRAIRLERLGGSVGAAFLGGMVEVEIQGTHSAGI